MKSMYKSLKNAKTLLFCLSLGLPMTQVSAQEITANTPWVWMGGDTTVGQPGLYGTKGIPGPNNKPGARSQAASWTDSLGNFWLFGGRVYSYTVTEALRNDLWCYSPFSKQWTWVSGDSTVNGAAVTGTPGIPAATNTPSARSLINYWTDKDGMFWVFGGVITPTAATRGNDLWKFNPYSRQWTLVRGNPATQDTLGVYGTMGTAAAANTPGGRSAATCWADAGGNLWLFGGQGKASTGIAATGLSDWWKYNISTNQWTWMGGPNVSSPAANYGTQGVMSPFNIPGGRYLAVSWKDTAGNFWMMGGVGYVTTTSGMLNDLWKFNPTLNQWVWMQGTNVINDPGLYISRGISSPERRPKTRRTTTTWTDMSGNLWLFGGTTSAFMNNAVNDIWKYDVAINQWTWVKGDSTNNIAPVYNTLGVASPLNEVGGRGTEVAWRSIKSNNVWVFGGHFPPYATRNDLWKIEACTPIASLPLITGQDTVCAGDTVTYTLSGISNALTYLWNVPAGWGSTLNANTISVVPNNTGGSLSVKVVSVCMDTSNIQVKNIVVSTITTPVISQSGSGGAISLSVSSTYASYQWYLNGTIIPGATAATYIPAANGIYTVEVRTASGCRSMSAGVNVNTLSLKDLQAKAGINIFPNPVLTELMISSRIDVLLAVVDVQGKVLIRQSFKAGDHAVDCSALSAGLYYVTFSTKDGAFIQTLKVVKK